MRQTTHLYPTSMQSTGTKNGFLWAMQFARVSPWRRCRDGVAVARRQRVTVLPRSGVQRSVGRDARGRSLERLEHHRHTDVAQAAQMTLVGR